MDLFRFHQGTSPLLISVPHAGLFVPEDIKARLTPEALAMTDTDWHVDRLYQPFEALGASLLLANYSRYVVDLNRPSDGRSLYPGQATTGLCPTEHFIGTPLYLEGEEPGADEIAERVERYWRPYHDQLALELERIKSLHGHAVLWDGHSINNRIPRLFDGELPDLNFGTNDGEACPAPLAERLLALTKEDGRYSSVLNGRFKGGTITRTYGNPSEGVSAIQLEMAQAVYMDQDTFAWDEEKARQVQALLGRLLALVIE